MDNAINATLSSQKECKLCEGLNLLNPPYLIWILILHIYAFMYAFTAACKGSYVL